MMSYSSVAAKVAQQKREQPERYSRRPDVSETRRPSHAPRVSNPEETVTHKAARELPRAFAGPVIRRSQRQASRGFWALSNDAKLRIIDSPNLRAHTP